MEEFVRIWQRYPRLEELLWMVLAVALILVSVRVIQGLLSRRIRERDTRYRMRKVISFAGYVLVTLYALSVFSDKLRNLALLVGVLGAGMAFALQEVIVSVAGWMSISIGQVYKVGDRIQMGETRGDVIDIGVLRTTLMELGQWVDGDLYNGRIVRVSNGLVFREPIFNYSADFPFLWDEITVPIRYGSDLNKTRRLLEDAVTGIVGNYANEAEKVWDDMLRKFFIEKASVRPAVTISPDENWVAFTLRYVVDLKKRRSTRDAIYTRILEEIEASSGVTSLAATSMELSTAPYLDVRITDPGMQPPGSEES